MIVRSRVYERGMQHYMYPRACYMYSTVKTASLQHVICINVSLAKVLLVFGDRTNVQRPIV